MNTGKIGYENCRRKISELRREFAGSVSGMQKERDSQAQVDPG
ncbi:MAG TPA: hypothetical protein VFF30_02410 [Nitrososphaerales archaeon]|nr:hypothetical protein [Nitrososphaerales archaeon]